MYGELKFFIKTLTMLEISSTFLNNHLEFCFTIFNWLKITFDQSSALFDQSNRNRTAIKTSKNSRIFSLPFSINWAKVSTDRKLWFSNFHLENSRTWIFNYWNHILQTQTLLLQPIIVYTYIYKNLAPTIWSLISRIS